MDIGDGRSVRMVIRDQCTLIFFDGSSVEAYEAHGDPQTAAIEIISARPELEFIAAVHGAAAIMLRDSARTAECGMEWINPPAPAAPPTSTPAPAD